MPTVKIKPLSVNEAWQGKRFKTKKYKSYESQLLHILPQLEVPDSKIHLSITFGLSSKNADIDNPVKCFVDCLQKKYGFNDKHIYKMTLEKTDVKKGDEFISFLINKLD